MSKKIVAIDGGENGRLNENGIQSPYETKKIDFIKDLKLVMEEYKKEGSD